MDRGVWQAIVHGVARVGHALAMSTSTYIKNSCPNKVTFIVAGG